MDKKDDGVSVSDKGEVLAVGLIFTWAAGVEANGVKVLDIGLGRAAKSQ
jgi:hypothetical protein